MKRIFIFGILLVICCLSVSAQKKKDDLVWLTGTITEIYYRKGIDIYEGPKTGGKDGETEKIYLQDDTEVITLKTEDFRYFLSRKTSPDWHKKLKIKEGSPVKYAFEKDFIYLQNLKGRKFKYIILGKDKI